LPQIKIDEKTVTFEQGISFGELLGIAEIKDATSIIAAKIGESVVDLSAQVEESPSLSFIRVNDEEGIEILRHSTAHIMAYAVKRLFPHVKVTIGPSISTGFYYDFDVDTPFREEDLPRIEEEMGRIIGEDIPFERLVMKRGEAVRYFEGLGEPYKVELIEDIPDDELSLYRLGEFTDLCRGPHLSSSGKVKAFKLLQIAGAYWRGDEHKKMLSRIYGTSFPDRKGLKKHLIYLEEVKKRDHRRLGKELDLFSVNEHVGPGLILWHPKGAMVRNVIEDYWKKEHLEKGYELVHTPHIAKLDMWQVSGHLDFYRDNMYSPIEVEDVKYQVKPMNCPFHIQIFKSKLRSYRDLPVRYAELGTVYRFERSGVLHGLMRVRGFTQDDAHLFITPEETEEEIYILLDMTIGVLEKFGFEEYDVYLSTRPEKYVGSLDSWELAEKALKHALEKKGIPYRIDPGEGVFYGPKIDIKIKDVLGRSWQCSTIQVDFNNPERFDVNYIAEDGKEHKVIMIHRALMGSLERFFGILIEHYGGAFPPWLAPVQAAILPITDRHMEYSKRIGLELRGEGIRVFEDFRNEKLSFKIRDAQVKKIPFNIIIGDKEMEEESVSLRKRGNVNLSGIGIPELKHILRREIEEKEGSDSQEN
jgi:threonyl-tRNA synthetase